MWYNNEKNSKEAFHMAEQVLVQASVDKDLKQEVTEIYEALGMDLPTAIRMFFVKSKMERGIPFDTTLPKNVITRSEAMRSLEDMFHQASDVPEMSIDEINAEIADVRAKRKAETE
jgi:DNA-damage-inducible protein J